MDKGYVEAIASKHAALHAQIDAEEHRPHPDEDLLTRLKKEKLRLKTRKRAGSSYERRPFPCPQT
jgi:hypothetical protein